MEREFKFEVGQTVRILDGSGIPDYTEGWDADMERFVGRITKVIGRSYFSGKAGYSLDIHDVPFDYVFDERGLEAAEDDYMPFC